MTLAATLALTHAAAVLVLSARDAEAQTSVQGPSISGAWERLSGEPDAEHVPPPAAEPKLRSPYREQWEARRRELAEAAARGEPLATSNTFCIPAGMPAMMAGPFPFEFLQSPGQVTIVQEAYNQIRRIYLDEPQLPLEELEPGFYGRSVGRWEGDTLSVDTIGIKDYVRYQEVPHSPEMRIRERIRLVAPDVLWDEITIEDPQVLEEPWTFTFAYRRMPDYEILEYVCEDNREYADEDGVTRLRLGTE